MYFFDRFFVCRAKLREKRKAVFDLPERLQAKWDEMNIRRLMKILMAMKMIDTQQLTIWTRPEKERLAYNEGKRKAIAQSFRNILDDVSTLRTRLLPVEITDEYRKDVVRQSLAMIFDESADRGGGDDFNKEQEYDQIQRETMEFVCCAQLFSMWTILIETFLR